MNNFGIGKSLSILLLIFLLSVIAFPIFTFAGGTPIGGTASTNLLEHNLSDDSAATLGDYVNPCVTNALCGYYYYKIEVPPGQTNLTVDIFDADVCGSGTSPEANGLDTLLAGGSGTISGQTATYELFNPSGTLVATLTGTSSSSAGNNAWTTIGSPIVNPVAGHWTIRVSEADADTNDNYSNAYGIRAHDGSPTLTSFSTFENMNKRANRIFRSEPSNAVNSTAKMESIQMDSIDEKDASPILNSLLSPQAGTEYNVYSNNYYNAAATTGGSRTYDRYPYILGGCNMNNFAFDNDAGISTHTIFTRLGSSAVISPSTDGQHLRTTLTFYNTANATILSTTNYGIWNDRIAYASGNDWGTFANGDYRDTTTITGANPFDTTNGRTYLPTDAGTAPVKSYVTQSAAYFSGLSTPTVGYATYYTITISAVNPEAFPVTFSSPTNIVSATIPGGEVTYNGNATVSQGTILSQPSLGGSGAITWNPGVVAAGTTQTLTYRVGVYPTSIGIKPLTGASAGAVDVGTNASFVDITGQSTTTTGELCELHVTAQVPTASNASIRGRIITLQGRAISNVLINLTNANTGELSTARTNSFGYFNFNDLPSGDLYVLTPVKRGYAFDSHSFNLNENLDGLEIIGYR
jgi:hypothetical protein